MKSKRFFTVALLVFVFISLGYIVFQQTKTIFVSSPEVPSKDPLDSPHIEAYYFHGNSRCYTCNTIEAYTKETLETDFTEEIARKALLFRVINVETPENQHFIQEFQLTSPTVVLARKDESEVSQFKNLNRVWKLVKNKEQFQAYIREETRTMLEGPQ